LGKGHAPSRRSSTLPQNFPHPRPPPSRHDHREITQWSTRRALSVSHLLTFCPRSVTSLTPCSERLTTSETIPSSVRDLSRPRVKGTTQNEHMLLQPRMMDSQALSPCKREGKTNTRVNIPDAIKFMSRMCGRSIVSPVRAFVELPRRRRDARKRIHRKQKKNKSMLQRN
jgi:hypothetical protein